MATSLTTKKMNPALAARVEKSVRGGRPGFSPIARRAIAFARLGLIPLVMVLAWTILAGRKREQREIEQARTDLLESVKVHAASLEEGDMDAATRAESWLERLTAPEYGGDVVSGELRGEKALSAALARPTLYVRGPIDGFQTVDQIAETARSSPPDALVLCLIDPPSSRSEKTVLQKVRAAYAGDSVMVERTANVRTLHEVIVGLPFLTPAWSEKVRAAEEQAELKRLRAELDHAPIERAKEAAKARQFLVVLDEGGDGPGPIELDGERAHFIRIALVDLAASKIVLGVRQHVDPSWISPANRPTYARGLDSCALAFDVHARLAEK